PVAVRVGRRGVTNEGDVVTGALGRGVVVRFRVGGHGATAVVVVAAGLAFDPGGDGRWLDDARDMAAHPQHEQPDDVLAGHDTARAGAAVTDVDVIDRNLVGLRRRTVVA